MRGTLVNTAAVLVGTAIGLEIKRLRVANLLPALVVVVPLTQARLALGW